MKYAKTIMFALLTLAITLVASTTVAADPYDGVNRIGTYYQQTNTFAYNYQYDYAYDYIAPPRAGGWFGSGSEWITGLRSPVYAPVPPVHYANYYQQTCGLPCWFGGSYGYPRQTAASFGYRGRIGGIQGY